ncbi:hypothetical protein H5410_003857 [Solanum commersonii]|uniref:Uncharacterized protein n=1 Tax=Solanum commersonii TaxID=4109 RepID=A0A9J6B6E5_SOLCO|nr:hypothetical protein H5410_003857 [Solanum commersonii]
MDLGEMSTKSTRLEEVDIPQNLDLLKNGLFQKLILKPFMIMVELYKLQYNFLLIGMVQIDFKPLTLKRLPETFVAALRA